MITNLLMYVMKKYIYSSFLDLFLLSHHISYVVQQKYNLKASYPHSDMMLFINSLYCLHIQF